MIKRFENKLVMLKALLKLLKLNRSLWQDFLPFVNAVNELESLVAQIEATRLITDANNSGIVDEKTDLQNLLINKAFEIASMLHAMASSTKNQVLLKKVDFPISELQRQRDGELGSTCKGIEALARENMPALVGYPVSPPELDGFATQIEQYVAGLPNHRVSVSERKAANEKLKDFFKMADDVLINQIDRMMFRFSTTAPDFYASFLNARKVVEYGIRHEKPEVEAKV